LLADRQATEHFNDFTGNNIFRRPFPSGKSRSDGYEVLHRIQGSPYSITERRVPELIPVLGSQPAVSHIPGGRLPLLSARPAATPAALKRAAANFAAW